MAVCAPFKMEPRASTEAIRFSDENEAVEDEESIKLQLDSQNRIQALPPEHLEDAHFLRRESMAFTEG